MKNSMMKRTALLLPLMVLAVSATQIDSKDSATVREILDSVGWKNVPVQSVVTGIGPNNRVTDLNLSYRALQTKITALPSSIVKLPELITLNLNDNSCTTLPDAIGGNLLKLSTLKMKSNALQVIPDPVYKLPSLQVLDLSGNQISAIASSIGNMSKLTTFTCNHNRLTKLPSDIKSMTGLKYFSLSANMLDSIPAEIGKLVVLEYLWLDSNNLTTLPVQIEALQNLHISVTVNKLCSLDPQMVTWLNAHPISNVVMVDWRSSQLCPSDSLYSAFATDIKSNTVVAFTSKFRPTMAVTNAVAIASVNFDSAKSMLPARTELEKLVRVSINPVFQGKQNTFDLTFTYGDLNLAASQLDPSRFLIGFYNTGAMKLRYLIGTVDLTKKTIAVQSSTEGVFAFIYQATAVIVPLRTVTQPSITLTRNTLSIVAEQPSIAVSFFSLDGRMVKRELITSTNHHFTLGIPQALPSKSFILMVETGGMKVSRIFNRL